MTTTRDVIAQSLRNNLDDVRSCEELAAEIEKDLLSAPGSDHQELAALLNPWREIETAPTDETYILMWGPPNNYGVGYFSEKGQSWDWDNHNPGKPTRWCALPAPPSEDKT